MNSQAWIVGAVSSVRRTEMTWWAVRLASVAAGLGAVAELTDIAGGWRWSLLFVPVIAIWRMPDGRAAARRMDAAAELNAEIECAWDHREETSAIHVAQRDRARARFAQASTGRVVPVPNLAWFLPAVLWFAVPTSTVPGVNEMARSVADSVTGSGSSTGTEGGDTAKTSPGESAATRATIQPPSQAQEPKADGAPQTGQNVAGRGKTGGVGRQAGDRSGGRAGHREVKLGGQNGQAVAIGTALGVAGAGPVASGRALVGRSPPPPDAIADPARRYPRRYHAAIAQWFDRERE